MLLSERKKRIELLVRILSSSALQAAPFPLGTLSLLLYHLFLVKDFFLGIAEGTRTLQTFWCCVKITIGNKNTVFFPWIKSQNVSLPRGIRTPNYPLRRREPCPVRRWRDCRNEAAYSDKEMFCEVGWFSYYSCPHFPHPTLLLVCETVPFYSHTQNIGGRDESRTRKRG